MKPFSRVVDNANFPYFKHVEGERFWSCSNGPSLGDELK